VGIKKLTKYRIECDRCISSEAQTIVALNIGRVEHVLEKQGWQILPAESGRKTSKRNYICPECTKEI
jgi:hypothetical protein